MVSMVLLSTIMNYEVSVSLPSSFGPGLELKRGLNSISKAYGALLRWEEDGNTIGA